MISMVEYDIFEIYEKRGKVMMRWVEGWWRMLFMMGRGLKFNVDVWCNG